MVHYFATVLCTFNCSRPGYSC